MNDDNKPYRRALRDSAWMFTTGTKLAARGLARMLVVLAAGGAEIGYRMIGRHRDNRGGRT